MLILKSYLYLHITLYTCRLKLMAQCLFEEKNSGDNIGTDNGNKEDCDDQKRSRNKDGKHKREIKVVILRWLYHVGGKAGENEAMKTWK